MLELIFVGITMIGGLVDSAMKAPKPPAPVEEKAPALQDDLMRQMPTVEEVSSK